MKYYILEGRIPTYEPDLIKWAKWFEENRRHIAYDRLDDADISTVFLGIDHNWFCDDDPILYESMIFGGPLDGEQNRYHTWQEAEEGHKELVKRVKDLKSKNTTSP